MTGNPWVFGYSSDEFVGLTYNDALVPALRKHFGCCWQVEPIEEIEFVKVAHVTLTITDDGAGLDWASWTETIMSPFDKVPGEAEFDYSQAITGGYFGANDPQVYPYIRAWFFGTDRKAVRALARKLASKVDAKIFARLVNTPTGFSTNVDAPIKRLLRK